MSTVLKKISLNLVALLAQYVVTKVADNTTTFAPTKAAIANVALQSVSDAITAQLQKSAGVTTTDTTAQ